MTKKSTTAAAKYSDPASAHPSWCERGAGCATHEGSDGFHYSTPIRIRLAGCCAADELRVGLERSVAAEVDRVTIDYRDGEPVPELCLEHARELVSALWRVGVVEQSRPAEDVEPSECVHPKRGTSRTERRRPDAIRVNGGKLAALRIARVQADPAFPQTQAEFAAWVGVSASQLALVERGTQLSCGADWLRKVATGLGLDVLALAANY